MILPTKSLYETHENQNGFSRKSKTILVSFVTRIKNSFVPLSSISIQLNMANVYEERLGTDRMLPLIFRMALPAIAAQLVNLLYNLVDRIYIGHIPEIGANALAGVGVTSSIIILISSFSAIVGAGGSPLAAMALGQGDRVRAGKILGNGFILLIIFTLLTSLTTYLFMRPLLFLTGASKQTIGYAVDYLSVYLIGTLFVELSVGLNCLVYSGIGHLSFHYGQHRKLGRIRIKRKSETLRRHLRQRAGYHAKCHANRQCSVSRICPRFRTYRQLQLWPSL